MQQRRQAEQSRQFGATVQRGPQYVNIYASLTVDAGGDVIFGEDGMAIVKDNLSRQMQEALDNGEVVVPSF